jgi:uncharacterized DUF497 family protein
MGLLPTPDDIYASPAAREHMLVKHDVEFEEAVEVLTTVPGGQRVRGGSPGERRYMMDGQTDSGRRLRVVFVRESGRRIRVITAYESGGRKRRRRHGRR